MSHSGIKLFGAVGFLLLLNLVSFILVKISPQYYGQHLFLFGIVACVFCCCCMITGVWLYLGKHYQLSFVYPLMGINYVLSLFVGITVFNEPFVLRRLIGAVIILCGVALISCSNHRGETRGEGETL